MQEIKFPLKQVFFEIVGKCNAKCTYCITGNGTQTGDFVDVDKFKETITSLFERKIVDFDTNFDLYNCRNASRLSMSTISIYEY